MTAPDSGSPAAGIGVFMRRQGVDGQHARNECVRQHKPERGCVERCITTCRGQFGLYTQAFPAGY